MNDMPAHACLPASGRPVKPGSDRHRTSATACASLQCSILGAESGKVKQGCQTFLRQAKWSETTTDAHQSSAFGPRQAWAFKSIEGLCRAVRQNTVRHHRGPPHDTPRTGDRWNTLRFGFGARGGYLLIGATGAGSWSKEGPRGRSGGDWGAFRPSFQNCPPPSPFQNCPPPPRLPPPAPPDLPRRASRLSPPRLPTRRATSRLAQARPPPRLPARPILQLVHPSRLAQSCTNSDIFA